MSSAPEVVQIEIVPYTHADMEYPCHPETCCCPDYLLLVNGETINSGDWDWCVSVGQKLRALLDIQTESLSGRVAELEGEDAKWQPIETAPRDGTPFLAFMSSGWMEGMYFDDGHLFYLADGDMPARGRKLPSHWMPLPAPPGATKPAERADG